MEFEIINALIFFKGIHSLVPRVSYMLSSFNEVSSHIKKRKEKKVRFHLAESVYVSIKRSEYFGRDAALNIYCLVATMIFQCYCFVHVIYVFVFDFCAFGLLTFQKHYRLHHTHDRSMNC